MPKLPPMSDEDAAVLSAAYAGFYEKSHDDKLGEAEQRIALLKEALVEAVEEWASALNVMPNVRSRKRLDEVRALLERE